MSAYFPLVITISGLYVVLALILDKTNFKSAWYIPIFWLVPVLLAQNTDLPLNSQWSSIVLVSSLTVALGFALGQILVAVIIPKRGQVQAIYVDRDMLTATRIIGLFSLSAFIIIYIKSGIPLLSDDISRARTSLLREIPVLWSMTQISLIFATSRMLLKINGQNDKIVNVIFYALGLLILLSGWRSYLLSYFVYAVAGYFLIRKISIMRLIMPGAGILMIFSTIGYIRGDLGVEFTLIKAIEMIGYYVYPAFLNFEMLATYEYPKPTLFAFQFMLKPLYPLIGFETVTKQYTVEAFNVSTGMSPLYADGGLPMLLFIFFMISVSLRLIEYSSRINLLKTFIYVTLFNTLLLMHNGWYLLNFTFTYNLISYAIIIWFLKLMRK